MIDSKEKLELLQSCFGEPDHWRDGVNHSFSCPNCGKGKNKKKLVIRLDTEQWHCWVCEIGGKSIDALLKKYAPRSSFNEWQKKFGDHRRVIFDDDPIQEKPKLELPDCVPIEYLVKQRDPDGKAIIGYLQSRGIDLDIAYRYRLCGIIKGRNKRRIVFPSFDSDGELNYWTARTIDKDAKMRYINASAPRRLIVFNEVDINWQKPITIVEGPFDVLSAGDNAIPLLGSFLTKDSLLFTRIAENKTPVVLALDPDAATKTHKIASLLYSYDIDVSILTLPQGEDPSSLGLEAFKNLLPTAKRWQKEDKLRYAISIMSSGSMI